jgi:hypothetical protein
VTRSDIDNDLARLLGPDAIPDEERSSIMARLAADDEAMSQFADATAVLRELEAEDGIIVVGETPHDEPPRVHEAEPAHDPKVVTLPPPSTRRTWRRPPARWLALAAVFVGALLVLPARFGGRGLTQPGELATLLDREAGLPPKWNQRPSATRSGGDPLLETEVGRAARLGVLWVDLELAAAPGKAVQADTVCSQIASVLDLVPAGGAVGLDCARMVPAAGVDPRVLRETREVLAARFEYEPHFALGAWAEVARLAVMRRDAGFFASRRSLQALDRIAASDDLALAARKSAQQVRARLSDRAPEWAVLKEEVDALWVAAHRPASLEELPPPR